MVKGYLLYKEHGCRGDHDYYRENIAVYLNKQKVEEEKIRLEKELRRKPISYYTIGYYTYNYEIDEVEIIE